MVATEEKWPSASVVSLLLWRPLLDKNGLRTLFVSWNVNPPPCSFDLHRSFLQPSKIQIAIGNTRAALHSNFIAYMLKNKTLFIHGLLQHSLPCKSGHEGMTPNVWWRLQLLMALHVLHCHLQTHSLFIDFKSTIDKLLKKKKNVFDTVIYFISVLELQDGFSFSVHSECIFPVALDLSRHVSSCSNASVWDGRDDDAA